MGDAISKIPTSGVIFWGKNGENSFVEEDEGEEDDRAGEPVEHVLNDLEVWSGSMIRSDCELTKSFMNILKVLLTLLYQEEFHHDCTSLNKTWPILRYH